MAGGAGGAVDAGGGVGRLWRQRGRKPGRRISEVRRGDRRIWSR